MTRQNPESAEQDFFAGLIEANRDALAGVLADDFVLIDVILHFGAKKSDISITGVAIPDPDSLLKWLAKDRAMVTFLDLNEIAAQRSAFTNLIREWIKHV